MIASFRVLATPSFDRDFRKTAKGNPLLESALHELVAILGQDPYNRSARHPIKKLHPTGNGEFAGANTVCDTTSMGAMWCCIPSGTGRKPTNCGQTGAKN
jgi:hypothetical protein